MASKPNVLPLPEQFVAARALLKMPYNHVAGSVGLSVQAVKNCEDGKTGRTDTILMVQHAYEQLGIEFIEPTARKGAGVRLKSPKLHRKPRETMNDSVSEQQEKLKAQLEEMGFL